MGNRRRPPALPAVTSDRANRPQRRLPRPAPVRRQPPDDADDAGRPASPRNDLYLVGRLVSSRAAERRRGLSRPLGLHHADAGVLHGRVLPDRRLPHPRLVRALGRPLVHRRTHPPAGDPAAGLPLRHRPGNLALGRLVRLRPAAGRCCLLGQRALQAALVPRAPARPQRRLADLAARPAEQHPGDPLVIVSAHLARRRNRRAVARAGDLAVPDLAAGLLRHRMGRRARRRRSCRSWSPCSSSGSSPGIGTGSRRSPHEWGRPV